MVGGVAAVNVWHFFKKSNMELQYGPAIPLPGIDPGELKTGVQTRTHTPMFINSITHNSREVETIQMSITDE